MFLLASRRSPVSVLVMLAVATTGCALQHRAIDGSVVDVVTPDGVTTDGSDVRNPDGPDAPVAEAGDVVDVPVDMGVCTGSEMLCGSTCIDVSTDVMHCGDCTTVCGAAAHATPTCATGTCGIRCDAGYEDCDHNPANGCEADLGSGANCGGCGVACSEPTPTCSNSGGTFACSSGCSMTEMRCGSSCTDLQTSVANCGACNNACSVTNGSPSCTSGSCTIASCNTGYGNCDSMTANGCETNTTNSTMHCGGCMRACAGGAMATAVCRSGTCGLMCNTGYGNCDGNNSNGCEARLTNDANNCGACGMRCMFANAAASCSSSACVLGMCTAGFGNCDSNPANGCETTFATDPDNCGSCGNVCTSGMCMSGTCRVPASCREIRMALGSAAMSGPFQIDPDGAGGMAPFTAQCDMTTAGGGWTLIFDPTNTDFDAQNVGYTQNNMTLRMAATEALIAFRAADRTVSGTWARFPMPVDWVNASPFTFDANDLTTDATVNGTGMTGLTLRYGWHQYGTDCASDWSTGAGQSFGRVCLRGTGAPFFAGFADPSGDYCQGSGAMRDATACSSSLKFTIAVR